MKVPHFLFWPPEQGHKELTRIDKEIADSRRKRMNAIGLGALAIVAVGTVGAIFFF